MYWWLFIKWWCFIFFLEILEEDWEILLDDLVFNKSLYYVVLIIYNVEWIDECSIWYIIVIVNFYEMILVS